MKVVTLLIPSFHGPRYERLGAQPPFCVLNIYEEEKRLADYDSVLGNLE